MSRDQSEDRVAGPLYLTVGYEHPKHGLVYYVQNPNGDRSSIYAKNAGIVNQWAIGQMLSHPEAMTGWQPDFLLSDLVEDDLPHPAHVTHYAESAELSAYPD